MAKIHNKRRNTAFLFESLVRELTRASLNGNKERQVKIKTIIQESFSKGSLLRKELNFYQTLLECESVDDDTARRIVEEVLKEHRRVIPSRALWSEQGTLIKKINGDLSPKVFSNFIPNYRDLATISRMFSEKTAPKERVLLENRIVEGITKPEEEKKELKPLDNLEFRMCVERFNKQYGASLLKEQMELLSKYITSSSNNGVALKVYLNEEIGRLKEEMKTVEKEKEVQKDTVMQERVRLVQNILDECSHKPINEKLLNKIFQIQELVREVNTDE